MTYDELLHGLMLNGIIAPEFIPEDNIKSETHSKLFDVDDFIIDLRKYSYDSNKKFIDNSERLNAYDLAHSCIRTGIFRVLNYPIKNYANNWLPIVLRGIMGTSAHELIQSVSKTFTEKEVYLRIPSRKISVKIDCLINTDVLVEIKTCPYTEYDKILKTGHARIGDFLQAILYKYLLETHIEESKKQELPKDRYFLPKFDKYDIKMIQMIYICNDLFSSESDLDTSVKYAKDLRKKLNSKYNTMWFIKSINYDLSKINIKTHISMLKEKLDVANQYLDEQKVPPMTNKFVDKKKCFFCLYKTVCNKTP